MAQKIRIKIRSFDHEVLDRSAVEIVQTARGTGATVFGPVPLPTERRRFCVLRSPHVDKKSREHFELCTHRRVIDIVDPTQSTMDALTQLQVPSGVDIEIKL